jgi:signal transduction histidine kinase
VKAHSDVALRATGAIAWSVTLISALVDHARLTATASVALGLLSFGVASSSRVSERARQWAWAAQLVGAVATLIAMPEGLAVVTWVVVAAQLPVSFDIRVANRALWLLLVVSAGLAFVLTPAGESSWANALSLAGFEAFAFAATAALRREFDARAALAQAHRELLDAQQQLAEAHRTAERLHIARELHDRVGHLLTALCLRLELAVHSDDARARHEVSTARAQARDLLAEVRAVVGALRDSQPLDLNDALPRLAAPDLVPAIDVLVDSSAPMPGADRKSTRLNSSHNPASRMPSSA